jgi:hypothetical protein
MLAASAMGRSMVDVASPRIAVLFLVLGACGGKIDTTSASGGRSSADNGSAAANVDPNPAATPGSGYPPEGSWGLWQLSAIAGEGTAPPFLELDLHPEGIAYLWTCSGSATGNGLPCPPLRRQGCTVGTVSLASGAGAWTVALTDTDGRMLLGRGDVVEDASGDVMIDGTGDLPPRARYHRVSAPSRERCFP